MGGNGGAVMFTDLRNAKVKYLCGKPEPFALENVLPFLSLGLFASMQAEKQFKFLIKMHVSELLMTFTDDFCVADAVKVAA